MRAWESCIISFNCTFISSLKQELKKTDFFFPYCYYGLSRPIHHLKGTKKICRLSDTKNLVHSSTSGKRSLWPQRTNSHMNRMRNPIPCSEKPSLSGQKPELLHGINKPLNTNTTLTHTSTLPLGMQGLD